MLTPYRCIKAVTGNIKIPGGMIVYPQWNVGALAFFEEEPDMTYWEELCLYTATDTVLANAYAPQKSPDKTVSEERP